jgi:hypothetical protein
MNLYIPPPDIVVASCPRVGRTAVEGYDTAGNIQNLVYELPKRPLLGTLVNKGKKQGQNHEAPAVAPSIAGL